MNENITEEIFTIMISPFAGRLQANQLERKSQSIKTRRERLIKKRWFNRWFNSSQKYVFFSF